MRHLRRHWPLAILIALQLATIGLYFERAYRVEMRVEAFENLVRMALDRAYNIGRKTCPPQQHLY